MPSHYDITKAQVQDLVDTAGQMVGGGQGYLGSDYQPFQNTKAVLGTMSPQDVIRQDFSTLKSSTPLPQRGYGIDQGMPMMTEPEINLYLHHMDNLIHGGFVEQQGGGISTVRNITIEQDGKHYVIPTIWNGRELSPGEAISRARSKGLDYFPSYESEQKANDRYINELHPYMERDVAPLRQILSYLRSKGLMQDRKDDNAH